MSLHATATPQRAVGPARAASVLAVATVLVAAIAAPILDLATGDTDLLLRGPLSTGTIWALAFTPIGALMVARHPRNSIGWIFCAIGVSQALAEVSSPYATYALGAPARSLPGGAAMAWLADWVWFVGYGLLATFVLLLFPTGRLPSSRWRPVAWLAGAAFALMAAAAVALIPLQPGRTTVGQPLEGEAVAAALGTGALLVLVACAPLCLAALVLRLRRSTGVEREQLKWFAYAGVVAVLAVAVANLSAGGLVVDAAHALAGVAVPGAAGIAIVRHRLLDIDVVINRSLVYGLLTAGVVGCYVGVVALAGTLWERSGLGATVLAAGIVAVLFHPARERLQRMVDRLTYGEREPYIALSRFGAAVGSSAGGEDVLAVIASTIARMLRLPYVAIELDGPPAVTVPHGALRATEDPVHAVPLETSAGLLGRLVVAPRSGEQQLGPAELRLLQDLARQTAAACYAVGLNAELQRARVQLVTAREEERRGIRRDLHDDLGPTLAAVALQIGAARKLLATDPSAADASLVGLARRVEDTIAEVRHLIHGLRPPALDELGLADSVRALAERLSTDVTIRVDAGSLGPLPPAVDAAAYRIVEEALTNVTRHAGAQACLVRLRRDDALCIDVEDDGRGLPDVPPPGVGLASMQQRAGELGGTCTIETRPTGGTQVRARLPLLEG
jgi:signal transduction histidine kinase